VRRLKLQADLDGELPDGNGGAKRRDRKVPPRTSEACSAFGRVEGNTRQALKGLELLCNCRNRAELYWSKISRGKIERLEKSRSEWKQKATFIFPASAIGSRHRGSGG